MDKQIWKCRSICFLDIHDKWLKDEKKRTGKKISEILRDLINEKRLKE